MYRTMDGLAWHQSHAHAADLTISECMAHIAALQESIDNLTGEHGPWEPRTCCKCSRETRYWVPTTGGAIRPSGWVCLDCNDGFQHGPAVIHRKHRGDRDAFRPRPSFGAYSTAPVGQYKEITA